MCAPAVSSMILRQPNQHMWINSLPVRNSFGLLLESRDLMLNHGLWSYGIQSAQSKAKQNKSSPVFFSTIIDKSFSLSQLEHLVSMASYSELTEEEKSWAHFINSPTKYVGTYPNADNCNTVALCWDTCEGHPPSEKSFTECNCLFLPRRRAGQKIKFI
jgi:hypothetical protein